MSHTGDERESMTNQLHMLQAWITPALLQDGAVIGNQPSTAPAAVGGDQAATTQGGFDMFLLILLMFGGMILIMSLTGRKDKKRRAQMLKELGKKDKVRTAGGIIGTVIEMKDDEVLLETDRASHTRLWLAKGSITSVVKQAKTHSNDSSEEEATTTNA